HLSPGSGPPSRPVIDIAQLREQWGRFEDPLQRLSAAGLEQIDRLLRRAWMGAARERFRIVLEPPDWLILNRYLLRRLALIRRRGRPLRRAWSKLQGRENQAGSQGLDLNGPRSRPAKSKKAYRD
ncbi:MAG: hypothetical protein HW378_3128, partial [Anaerolineales bacterium]|nr:hypothetical protein [Anaerolineales bacterium]